MPSIVGGREGLAQTVERYVEQSPGIQILGLEGIEALAGEYGLSRREVEMAVLELGILPRRYLRNYGTVGLDGQLALLRSSVAVIGLGGLGGYIVEGLARMGVGRLTLVDGDVFCDHNLNRQLLSSEENLGQPKALVASDRVHKINRATEVAHHSEYATRENLPEILLGVDVVVDALDRLTTRLMLQDVAGRLGLPMVHGAIAGSMGQVMTILPGDVGLRALYGEGPIPEHGAEAELGTPPASPMMVAAWQVHEAIKILTDRGDLLRGRMLLMDASVGDVRILELYGIGC
jgi:molybdopterin/thiamine biosynthesis adenylyltransferase